MEAGQEELVELIFGDSPPEGWRDDPELLLHLQELGQLSPERAVREPERLAQELAGVQAATQHLAFSNYKTFIQTSSCSREIQSSFTETEAQLDSLLDTLPRFRAECGEFEARARELGSHRRLTSLTLARHTALLEVLELPQLMETVVRNGHYDEALELQAYVARLVKKQPGVAVLEAVGRAVAGSLQLMLQQLLGQLRTAVQLPHCLRVVSYLRRLDVFGETELRLRFLQAREAWLDSVVGWGQDRTDPAGHLARTMELLRVHLFDIVTQYRAIFTDEDPVGLGEGEGQANRLLFTSWLGRKLDQLLAVVAEDLAAGAPPSESLLGQAMYFGLSFSRVGFDFRPLLAPLFLDAVERQFVAALGAGPALAALPGHLSALSLARLAAPAPPAAPDPATPPLRLMDYPPLAHLANSALAGLNSVRQCAPLPLAPAVTLALQDLLVGAAGSTLDWHSAVSRGWTEQEEQGFRHLCSALSLLLLPHLQAALAAVYPPGQLAEVTGLPPDRLAGAGLGGLDTRAILAPLQPFLPRHEAAVAGPGVAEAGRGLVADRMGELAAALEGCQGLGGEPERSLEPASGAKGPTSAAQVQTSAAEEELPIKEEPAAEGEPAAEEPDTVEEPAVEGAAEPGTAEADEVEVEYVPKT